MRRDSMVLAVPSVVYTVVFFYMVKRDILLPSGLLPKFGVGFVLFNVYCFGISQLSKLGNRDPFKYLWIFSGYVSLPVFLSLLEAFGRSSIIAPFLSYSTVEIVEFWLFKDVFLGLALVRLLVLTILVWGYVAWSVV